MNKKLFKMLCDNFGKPLNIDLYNLFDSELKDYDPILVETAILKILNENKFFPALSDIKNAIKDLSELIISDEEKIKRWKSKGITPDWVENPELCVEEPASAEEIAEMEALLAEFK